MSKSASKRKPKESEVLDFVVRLATEPEMFSAYQRDPDAVMNKAGLDGKARKALASGDPQRVHRSISATAAADEEALQKSVARAKEVERILTSDPLVAQWVQNHYYQSLMTWLASGGAVGQPPAAPADKA